MKRVLSVILAVIMLATVLAGCSTLEEGDKGAVIDMYLTTEVYNFDPQVSYTDDSMLKVFSLIFEGLTKIDDNGKWQKALMKSYTIDVDDGEEFTILITLNDTRWSDGRTVQAEDIIYSWKRLLDPDSKNEAAALLYDVKNARAVKTGDATVDDLGVAAVDTYVLEVQFEQKIDLDMFFENLSSPALVPLREDVITQYGDVWAQKSTTIVTNGPFAIKELEYGVKLRLERSQYYYLDQDAENQALDTYVIPYRMITTYSNGDTEAQLDLLLSGDIFYLGEIPLSQRAQYADSAVITDEMVTHSYYFNINNPLFEKAEVRTALSMALDRNEIVNIVTYAKAATGFVPYGAYDTTTKTDFRENGGTLISSTADVAGAKSLLTSAGVTSGSFSITVRNNEVDLAIAEYVAGVWNSLGFTVTVESVKGKATEADTTIYEDVFETKYKAGDFDVIAVDMTMLSPDPFSILAPFATSFSGNGVDMDSETYDLYGHITGYSSEAYDAIIENVYAATDRASKAAAMHEAETQLVADMPVIPIVFLQDAYLYSSELSGIKTTYYATRDFKKMKLKDYMQYKETAADDSSSTSTSGT